MEDVATALTVMAGIGYDADDNSTASIPHGLYGADFSTNLSGGGSLSGLRLGLIEGFFNRTPSTETDPVNEAMDDIVSKLEQAGAMVVPILDPLYNATAIANDLDTQRYEYREQLTSYLQNPQLGGQHPDSTEELYSGDDFLVIPSQYEYVSTALVSSTSNGTWHGKPSYSSVKSGVQNLVSSNICKNRKKAIPTLTVSSQDPRSGRDIRCE